MQIAHTINEMRAWSQTQRTAGRRIAFVPTMGALHGGHLSLLREGKKRGDSLVLSIYVNPAQFSLTEDLAKYPRDLDGDLAKARAEGVNAVFLPTDAVMYPERYQTCVLVEQVTKSLCGESRPTHFRGVTTVVAKLFNIVQPDAAIFGEKDFQQLVAIKTMARDLDMPVEIVGCPIVREADGLAMSSRNKYLSAVERSAALALNKSLAQADGMIRTGETDSMKILSRVRSFIEDEGKGLVRLDYAKIVDAETLTDLPEIKRPALLALAAFVGKTRLIDNRAFAY
ncbi:MAG: pantoate--beta-alanine ligase [bacterium]